MAIPGKYHRPNEDIVLGLCYQAFNLYVLPKKYVCNFNKGLDLSQLPKSRAKLFFLSGLDSAGGLNIHETKST